MYVSGFCCRETLRVPPKPRDTKNSAIKARAYRDIHAWSVSSATAQATVCAPRKTPSRACCADCTRCGRVGRGPAECWHECGASRPAWRCPFLDSSQQQLHQTCCAGCSEFDIRVYTLLYTPRLHPAPRDLLVVFCARLFSFSCCDLFWAACRGATSHHPREGCDRLERRQAGAVRDKGHQQTAGSRLLWQTASKSKCFFCPFLPRFAHPFCFRAYHVGLSSAVHATTWWRAMYVCSPSRRHFVVVRKAMCCTAVLLFTKGLLACLR